MARWAILRRFLVVMALVSAAPLLWHNGFQGLGSANSSPAGSSSLASDSTAAVNPCGSPAGARFNLEPRDNPLPQNGTAIDFLPGGGIGGADLVVGAANDMRLLTAGSGVAPDFRGVFGMTSQTGFYVHRYGGDTSPCSADLEGGLGAVTSPATGNPLVGVGYPAVAAYPPGRVFFLADTRVSEGEGPESAVGVFRTTAANLNDSSVCPDGTLSESNSATCWPVKALVNLGSAQFRQIRSPHLAVDERSSGAGLGAGDVYVAGTELNQLPGGGLLSSIFLAACTNDLSACSSRVIVSGTDNADLAHVAIRPGGGVTVSYVVPSGGSLGIPAAADIKYVACAPSGAPSSPSCASAVLVISEKQAIPFDPFNQSGLESARFVMHTFPKHSHRLDENGTETYLVWDRCKVSTAVPYPGLTLVNVCPDADVLMAVSSDNGQSWQFSEVDTGAQDQFQPWIATDRSTNTVNIAYYSSQGDPFQHRAAVVLRQIQPGPSTPDPVGSPQVLTSMRMEPDGDPVLQGIFIGHFIGLAARGTGSGGSRAYIHYMHTAVSGTYNGVADPEQNNLLSRFDY